MLAASLAAATFLPEGAYTTLRSYGRSGVTQFDEHVQRIEESARLLGCPVRVARAALRRLLCERLRALPWDASQEARVRLTLDCTSAARGSTLWISVEPLSVPPTEAYVEGVAVLTRPLHRDNPRAKDSAFIAATQGVRQLIGGRINEVLMVDGSGRILEGLSSNFFGVRDGTLITADEGVLPGLTRSLILDEAARAGIPVRLEAILLENMGALHEAFISSTSRAVLPVIEIDGQRVGKGEPGPLTRLLGERYRSRVQDEVEWLCEEPSSQN